MAESSSPGCVAHFVPFFSKSGGCQLGIGVSNIFHYYINIKGNIHYICNALYSVINGKLFREKTDKN